MYRIAHFKRAIIFLLALPSCMVPIDAGPGGDAGSTGGSTGAAMTAAATGGNGVDAQGGNFGSASIAGQSGQAGQTGSGGSPAAGSSGSGGSSASAGGTSGGTSDAGGPVASGCTGGVMPGNIQQILQARCGLCHGSPPLAGVPASLVTTDGLGAASKTAPGQNVAQVAVTRIKLTTGSMRMPPAPLDPLTADEIQTFATWIDAGMPLSGCGSDGGTADTGRADGGARDAVKPRDAQIADTAGPADAGPDPFAAAPKCTSGKTWTGGTKGSQLMQPGEACITCHTKPGGDGPKLTFGGTVFPSGHEPSQCNGASAEGAQITVVDAAGKSYTATVNAAGNFLLKGSTVLLPPIKAKVAFMGKERAMITGAPSGDCNSCHTQAGTTTVTGGLKAPGRIVLP